MRKIIWICSIVIALLPSVFLVLQDSVDPRLLLLDPLVAAEVSNDCCKTYYGIFSTLGVLIWMATAAICGFAVLVLFAANSDRGVLLFALFACAFTGWLGFDDAFLFHENVAPKLGIPQTLILLIYCGLAAGYALLGWKQIQQNDWMLFIIAGGCLALSIFTDAVFHSTDPNVVILEDGAKFAGIVFWFSFHLSAMRKIVLRQFGHQV
ncbi:MAG: hypothetical protein AAGF54_15840 [Pseudomonadota bacterium]